MASVGEEDVDYESDPEEAKRSLAMRRRAAASDDEEGEGEVREKPGEDPRAGIHSDESDDQGGAAEYDDDEEELGLEEEEEIDEEEQGEDEVLEQEDLEGDQERGREGETGGRIEVLAVKESDGDGRRSVEESVDENAETQAAEEEEKKENEPFAVPTAGAFYMHDDRFRDNAVGRHRRTHGGRKLWESKDERKWGHDKFEEITLHERHNEEGKKPSKGPHVGRGRNRGVDRGFTRGNRSKEFDNNNQRQVPKGVRGRGPRRYEPAFRNNRQTPPTQNKQSGKPVEKNMQTNSERTFTSTSNAESDPVPARKNVFASSLNYFSPPFYPSGSSSNNKDISLTQKRDVQAGSGRRNVRSSVVQDSFHVPQTNPLLRGKNIAESVGVNKLYIDDSVNPAGKTLTNLQMPSSGSSFANTTQAPQSRVHGRSVIPGQMSYQPAVSQNQMTRASQSTTHHHAVHRNPVPSRSQLAVQASAQQLGQRPGSGSGTSSPPKTTMSPNSFESGEVESPSDSSKSKGALIAKGKGSVQGSGRSTLTYGGAQVMGSAHGDQNFPATPAFLPVMQFGGQHPGGMGVPAVGMAFPGYVAQPQLGLGNPEMTWLPVLAGAAGAMGATYCPPYISVDGSYHSRPSGQTSSVGSLSKENNANKTNNEWKPSQKPEIVGDEYGQRQNKPRRYSQMNVASEVLQNNTELV